MDPALLGVIIGAGSSAFFGLLTTVVSHWLTVQKDERQWQRQQAMEGKKIQEEQQKEQQRRSQENREHLQEAYQNSLRTLWLVVALGDKDILKPDEADVLRLYEEAHKWLAELALRISGHRYGTLDFEENLNEFTLNRQPQVAQRLVESISSLASTDVRIKLEVVQDTTKYVEDTKSESIDTPNGKFKSREIRVRIDDEFRRRQFVEGYELPAYYKFTCDLVETSPSQRKKLLESFSHLNKNAAPEAFTLSLGTGNKGQEWKARVNPFKVSHKDLFAAWEADYERYHIEQAQIKSAQNN